MDLAGLVNSEFLYTLDLRHPVSDEPLGISFKIRSAGSDAAKKVLREHTDRMLERRIKHKAVNSRQIETEELERAASYIASWDWGTNTYAGEIPAFSVPKAIAILEKEGWIFAQVVEAANKIANFTPASPPISANT